jgi:hypothetical protein
VYEKQARLGRPSDRAQREQTGENAETDGSLTHRAIPARSSDRTFTGYIQNALSRHYA